MNYTLFKLYMFLTFLTCFLHCLNKEEFRLKSKEMFLHAFNSYINNAYPADELMPLSCKGRYRNVEPSRGDIDDILGNFSLTLIDSLDTLYIMNEFQIFEDSVKAVINTVQFDSNISVSVFEVNIRVIGGLLGAHIAAVNLRNKGLQKVDNNTEVHFMKWYKGELLKMADDVARRLLPAFETHTGIPYPRVNLKYGYTSQSISASDDVSTCTACAGTIILEFAALSRLTGNPIYEEKASRAMNYIWEQRNRFSNLVGTTININDGSWMKKESGVGAGIDSYYEYLLKAYVLLGDDTYLHRFSIHYDAIKRYISTSAISSVPPLLLDVKMHQPLQRVKNFMDSLLAFWPGLQVLLGDVKQAIAFHEVLYQVMKRHSFLPEAFTTDFHVYWPHHLLRPEFLESNYFLYHSTGDKYYLDIGVQVLNNLEKYARVECGFAAIEDLRTMKHSDQMDSFVLAETFKYLYLLFAEPAQLPISLDNYIFTTEGHILPVDLSKLNNNQYKVDNLAGVKITKSDSQSARTTEDEKLYKSASNLNLTIDQSYRSCENHFLNADASTIIEYLFMNNAADQPIYRSPSQHTAALIREPLQNIMFNGGVSSSTSKFSKLSSSSLRLLPLQPKNLIPDNVKHVSILKQMGIQIHLVNDGRMQLFHQPQLAESDQFSELGEVFMAEMMKLTQQSANFMSHLYLYMLVNESSLVKSYKVAPAQFGQSVQSSDSKLGPLSLAALSDPFHACNTLKNNPNEIAGKMVIARRGDCMFIDKARNIEKAGGSGVLIIDNGENTSFDSSAIFSMSGDGKNDVNIPVVFIYSKEGHELLEWINMSGLNNVSLLITNKLFEQDKIEEYAQSFVVKEDEDERSFEKILDSSILRDLSLKSHAKIDLHFVKISNTFSGDSGKTIFDLYRVQLNRANKRRYSALEQYLLRIYPNEQLSRRYNQLDRNAEIFYDHVYHYFVNYTNINELDQNSTFFQLLRWAIYYDGNQPLDLPMDESNSINCLSSISLSLESQKYNNLLDLAMPNITTHAISFDINFFLLDKSTEANDTNKAQDPNQISKSENSDVSEPPHSEL